MQCPLGHDLTPGKGRFQLIWDEWAHTMTHWCTFPCEDGRECGWRIWPDGKTERQHRMEVR